jgi:hypothetical protein
MYKRIHATNDMYVATLACRGSFFWAHELLFQREVKELTPTNIYPLHLDTHVATCMTSVPGPNVESLGGTASLANLKWHKGNRVPGSSHSSHRLSSNQARSNTRLDVNNLITCVLLATGYLLGHRTS